MSCSLVEMSPEHTEQVAALEKLCFSVPWTREAFGAELDNPVAVYFVAVSGGRVLGYAGMHMVFDSGYITNVGVSPEQRHRGIGGALVERLTEEASARGCSALTLEVRVSNASAIALYEKHGFRVAGRRRGYYENPAEDAFIMLKVT